MENILLFGDTGRVGKLVLNYALQQGHNVTALVRNPEKLTVKHDNLKVVKGSSYELKEVEKAVEGCNVIISALNKQKTFAKTPREYPDLYVDTHQMDLVRLTLSRK